MAFLTEMILKKMLLQELRIRAQQGEDLDGQKQL